MAFPTVVAVATGVGDGNCNVPTGTANGDLMLAMAVVYFNNTYTLTPPTGWTEVYEQGSTTNSDSFVAALYSRVASSEPGSYDFVSPEENYVDVGIITLRHGDGTPVIDATSTNKANDATPTWTGVTTLGADRLLVGFGTNYGTDITEPSGTTTQAEWDGNVNTLWTKQQASAGASGNLTGSMGSGNWVTFLAAVGGPGGGEPPASPRKLLTLLGVS